MQKVAALPRMGPPAARETAVVEHMNDHQPADKIDAELIAAVVAGDTSAFAGIVARYRQRAFLAAVSIVGNEQDAYDLSQDAFIRAYRNLHKFDLARPFFPWFYRILKNRCLSFLRKRKRRAEVSMEVVAPMAGDSVDRDRLRLVRECVASLPMNHREIILLRYYQGYSYQEIAEILDKPVGTVMSGLYYARKKLKEALEEKGL